MTGKYGRAMTYQDDQRSCKMIRQTKNRKIWTTWQVRKTNMLKKLHFWKGAKWNFLQNHFRFVKLVLVFPIGDDDYDPYQSTKPSSDMHTSTSSYFHIWMKLWHDNVTAIKLYNAKTDKNFLVLGEFNSWIHKAHQQICLIFAVPPETRSIR